MFRNHLASYSAPQILTWVTHKFGNYNSLWDTAMLQCPLCILMI